MSAVYAGLPCSHPATLTEPHTRLSEQDKLVLDLAKRTFRTGGAKVEAIRTALGMSETGYFQRLNALLDHPAALAEEPILVRQLRQVRSRRRP